MSDTISIEAQILSEIVTNVSTITKVSDTDLVALHVNRAKNFINRYVGYTYADTELSQVADLIEIIASDSLSNVQTEHMGELSVTYKETIVSNEVMKVLKKLKYSKMVVVY